MSYRLSGEVPQLAMLANWLGMCYTWSKESNGDHDMKGTNESVGYKQN